MSKHPGVWILNPAGRHGYRLKFRDPDTSKAKRETLKGTKYQADTKAGERARGDAAVRKHNELLRRAVALESGAMPYSKVPLADAEKRFLATLKASRTVETYADGTRFFVAWAKKRGIRTTNDVTRGRLVEFREHLDTFDVAGATFDRRLRATKRMVSFWIDAEMAARVTYDDLKRIKQKNEPVAEREWLTPAQCKKMLESALRHDRGQEGLNPLNPNTPRCPTVAPFVMYVLLSGARASEALALRWEHVDLDALNVNLEEVGEITVPASISKTKKRRVIGLQETPWLRRMLSALQLRSGVKTGPVWDFAQTAAKRSRYRMIEEFGSPEFTYQKLRVTCDCYLNNSPGIYGGGAAFMAAKRLGHSVAISEKYYASAIRGIKPELHTLEEVLGIEKQCDQIINAVASPSGHASISRIAGGA
jgi:integrase